MAIELRQPNLYQLLAKFNGKFLNQVAIMETVNLYGVGENVRKLQA